MKRIFKGPWLWIVLAVVGVLLALQYLAPNGGYDEIESPTMQEHIASGEIKEITFVDAGDSFFLYYLVLSFFLPPFLLSPFLHFLS